MPGKLFVGNYRTQCRYTGAMAKSLATQWKDSARRATVKEAIHHIQPRRKSVYLALLVAKELYAIDKFAAEGFIEFMKPIEKGPADENR